MRTNNKGKKRIAIILTTIMALQGAFAASAFAATEPGIEQPEKPEATSYLDNEQIEEYNKKVDEYNAAAEEYNKAVDSEYEAAVAETEAMNAEIDQHNAAETERVQAAEARNAQAVKDAEEANAKIDEENAAEEARVNEYNKSEDEKVRASEEAKAAAEEENAAIQAHNEAVAKYEADKVQYDKDLAQYEYDVKIEKQILGLGYASVDDYNARINKAYNEPAKASVQKNAEANVVTVKDTYTVEEAAVKSGAMVKVHIEHNFEGTDISYVEDFEIDRNDILTVNSIAALGNATQPGYASLYYNTDAAHTMGYWVPWDELQYNARYVNSNWNCGTSYEISYKDGKNHANDEEVISMTYNYIWVPQKIYKTYNTPVAPTELTNPGEAKSLIDIPEIYKANYQQFVKKAYVEAQLEEIPEAALLEHIAAPVKAAYMQILNHMDLFEVPAVNEPAENEETPAADDTDTPVVTGITENNTPANGTPAVNTEITESAAPAAVSTEITENAAPMAAPVSVEIAENEAPMAAGTGYWALLNLLCTIGAALMSLLTMALYFTRRNREEDEEESELKKHGLARVLSLIPAIAAIVVFILTENMANPMRIADDWTLLMAVLFAANIVLAVLSRKTEKENEEEAEPAAC